MDNFYKCLALLRLYAEQRGFCYILFNQNPRIHVQHIALVKIFLQILPHKQKPLNTYIEIKTPTPFNLGDRKTQKESHRPTETHRIFDAQPFLGSYVEKK